MTMETVSELHRNGRRLVSQEYVTKGGKRAKIIVILSGMDGTSRFEGIATYEDGGTSHVWSANSRSLMATMKRMAKVEIDKR